jgi:hypothetical protein
VWAAFVVQAFLGDAQPLHWASANQVLGDNLRSVLGPHVAIPHNIGINHHHRPVLALVQAAGFVDAHATAQPGRLGQCLQLGMKIALAVARAGGPRRTLGPYVMTYKYMALKCGQAGLLLISICLQINVSPPIPAKFSWLAQRTPPASAKI